MKPILIVEDENIVRDSLRDWLADSGYQVDSAEEGEAALARMAAQDYGVVILDLRLPGKNGLEVLRQARASRPQLKGIIITAYPSVGTAIEAMKEGALDYLTKPLDLNALEKLIRTSLGPVQVEIRAKTAAIEISPPPAALPQPPRKLSAEEWPIHLKEGKALLGAGQYARALGEFQAVLAAAPESLETRIMLRKAETALAAPAGEAAAGAKPKECLWMRMGMVAFRICTNDYNCISCDFDQAMQEKSAAGSPELDAAIERLKELGGAERLCRYSLRGDVSYRVCSRVFRCTTCEFAQAMEDTLEQKMAKLAARREALRKKEQQTASR